MLFTFTFQLCIECGFARIAFAPKWLRPMMGFALNISGAESAGGGGGGTGAHAPPPPGSDSKHGYIRIIF